MSPELVIVEKQIWITPIAYTILCYLADGDTTKEIAEKVHRTENYIRKILESARLHSGCSTYRLVALAAIYRHVHPRG